MIVLSKLVMNCQNGDGQQCNVKLDLNVNGMNLSLMTNGTLLAGLMTNVTTEKPGILTTNANILAILVSLKMK